MHALEGKRHQRMCVPRGRCPLSIAIERLFINHRFKDEDNLRGHTDAPSSSTRRRAAAVDEVGF